MSYRVTKQLDIVLTDVTQGIPIATAKHAAHLDTLEVRAMKVVIKIAYVKVISFVIILTANA